MTGLTWVECEFTDEARCPPLSGNRAFPAIAVVGIPSGPVADWAKDSPLAEVGIPYTVLADAGVAMPGRSDRTANGRT